MNHIDYNAALERLRFEESVTILGTILAALIGAGVWVYFA